MEISSAALAGLFIGMGWALVKVVEYFIKKYGKNNNKMALIDNQAEKLDEIYQSCTKYIILLSKHDKSLETIEKCVIHLDELHSVYDENHVPKWYIPKEILSTINSIRGDIDSMNDNIKEELGKLYAGQSISVEKISELINSQKLVTERLGDLITLWAKVMKSN